MDMILHEEKVKMLKSWLGAAVALAGALTAAFGIWCYYSENSTEGMIVLVSMDILGLILIILGGFAKVTIEVSSSGIEVGYVKKFRYSSEEIESCEVLDRRSIFKRFYGFGIRFSREAIGFTVNGTDGVLVRIKDRRDVVICSDDPLILKSAIDAIIEK